MNRLRPKLTERDKARCAKLLTAFVVGDRLLVEHVFEEVDEADEVVGLLMALADAACHAMEHPEPPSDDGEAQVNLN